MELREKQANLSKQQAQLEDAELDELTRQAKIQRIMYLRRRQAELACIGDRTRYSKSSYGALPCCTYQGGCSGQ